MRKIKIDAVFEGGGVKGIAFVGAICCLEENNYSFEKVAGTSAGSIIASLIAVGYSGKEIKDILEKVDFSKFLDGDKLQNIPIFGKPLGLLKEKAIYDGKQIELWLKGLFEAKGKTKFKDVSHNKLSKLKIIASDITRREMIILPDDLSKYNIDPMEFEIYKAVRMSISIPFYFKPVKLEYDNKFSYIVDGGILSNFPIWIFDVKGLPRWPTFGFRLVEKGKSFTSTGKTDILSFLFDIANTMIDKDETMYVNDKEAVRTINIPTLGVQATNFHISKDKSMQLYNSGKISTNNFLNSWDFKEYIEKYRKKDMLYSTYTKKNKVC